MELLHGKKILLIGGSAGIGLATAQAAAAKGANVIIASSNQQKIDAALRTLPATGIVVNVNDEGEMKALFERTGPVDHLVYTAGESIQLCNLSDTDTDNARQYFNIRYWGAFMAVKYGAPYIQDSIVLTSGIASNRPGKGWSLGASICAAMEGFTRAMALELAPLRVNIVAPGVVKTDLWAGIPDREKLYQDTASRLPVGKVADAEDIARTYIYLMEQSYGTGQTLIVDGGASLV
jgi:NAD(P)-dependent dehydrogenase (short-subunit alcohol dehydrogenase family)